MGQNRLTYSKIIGDSPDAEGNEEVKCHEHSSKDHEHHVAKMKRFTTDLEALKVAAELQRQMTGEVDCNLLDNVNESIKRVTDLTSTVGTHDAADLLRTFGLTGEEAASMAHPFGSYLKAASQGVYEPNRQTNFVPFVPHPVEVNLYHPVLHANIIHSAYNSFKLSEPFQRKVDPAAEEERETCRKVMNIRDVGQTHSRPLASRISHRPICYSDTDSCDAMFCDAPKIPAQLSSDGSVETTLTLPSPKS